MTTKPTIAFTTLGCRVNQYDTQALKEQAEKAFASVPFESEADVYVVNTCTVTASADAEGRQLVRRAKRRNPDSLVVVTGCLAEDRPREVAALPGVDLVVGNREKSKLLPMIHSALSARPIDLEIAWNEGPLSGEADPWLGGISRLDGHQRAILKVQDGCCFGCAFCLIPRVRGPIVSRPVDSILEEAGRLASNGVKELVLAGIQLSSYGRDLGLKQDEPRLAPVIEKLLEVPGIQRVRLSSYAVADFEEALLPLWQKRTGLCPHLHLPLQSGDEEVLKAMRRPYRLDHFRDVVEKVRQAAPTFGITSDIIAGFPGETDEAFHNTLDRIREFDLVDFHPFPYSDRPGTPGEALNPKVPEQVIHRRMEELWALKKEALQRSARKAQGRVFEVVVEKQGEAYSGLSFEGLRLFFRGPAGLLGREVRVQVTGLERGRALACLV